MHSHGMVRIERKVRTVELTMAALAVPGDLIELGCNSGGTAVLMLATLRDYAPRHSGRLFYAADSFQGLPTPTVEDAINYSAHRHWHQGQHRTSVGSFNSNLRRNGLFEGDTPSMLRVLEGWFHDTLPRAPIERVAFLRLDGDLYGSTMDGLRILYDRVSIGGLIYADDYMATGCRRAVHEFRAARGITTPLVPVWSCCWNINGTSLPFFEAVWWQKQPAAAGGDGGVDGASDASERSYTVVHTAWNASFATAPSYRQRLCEIVPCLRSTA